MNACVRFKLGQQAFGLRLDQVREIAAAGRITPVPLAPSVLRGLANVRGRVITLIDVATIFGRPLPPTRFAEDRLVLILSAPWEHLGVYVHAPVEVAQAAAETFSAPPLQAMTQQSMTMTASGSHGGAPQESLTGMPAVGLATVAGEIVNILSAGDLVSFCEARILEGFRKWN